MPTALDTYGISHAPPMMSTSNSFTSRMAFIWSRRESVVLAVSAQGSGGSGAAGFPNVMPAQYVTPAAAAAAAEPPSSRRRAAMKIYLWCGDVAR